MVGCEREGAARTNRVTTWMTGGWILLCAECNSWALSLEPSTCVTPVLVKILLCSLCALRVCILSTRPVELSVLCSGNPKLHAGKNSFTALHQAPRNATMKNSNFAKRNYAKMRTTKTTYAAGFPAALETTAILSPDQQRSHILQILQIVDSDFDVFVHLGGWVYRAALLP